MHNKIDLHIHSICSDGSLTPKEIVDIAQKNNITTISITDHDTIIAYDEELVLYAREKNINLIPGVEISTKLNGVGIHVLGYNIDLKNNDLINTLSLLKNARIDYLKNVCNRLSELGYVININKLLEFTTVTKAHIATDIIESKENINLLLETFNHIPTKGEFIETIMNKGCPAYVEKFSISPVEASKIIKKANGKVILAHPVAYIYEDNLSVEQINEIVKQINPDGIEANYIYVDKNNNIINDSSFWNLYATNNNLLATIGSDFHQLDNIHPEIGFTNISFKISKDTEDKIHKALL